MFDRIYSWDVNLSISQVWGEILESFITRLKQKKKQPPNKVYPIWEMKILVEATGKHIGKFTVVFCSTLNGQTPEVAFGSFSFTNTMHIEFILLV